VWLRPQPHQHVLNMQVAVRPAYRGGDHDPAGQGLIPEQGQQVIGIGSQELGQWLARTEPVGEVRPDVFRYGEVLDGRLASPVSQHPPDDPAAECSEGVSVVSRSVNPRNPACSELSTSN